MRDTNDFRVRIKPRDCFFKRQKTYSSANTCAERDYNVLIDRSRYAQSELEPNRIQGGVLDGPTQFYGRKNATFLFNGFFIFNKTAISTMFFLFSCHLEPMFRGDENFCFSNVGTPRVYFYVYFRI